MPSVILYVGKWTTVIPVTRAVAGGSRGQIGSFGPSNVTRQPPRPLASEAELDRPLAERKDKGHADRRIPPTTDTCPAVAKASCDPQSPRPVQARRHGQSKRSSHQRASQSQARRHWRVRDTETRRELRGNNARAIRKARAHRLREVVAGAACRRHDDEPAGRHSLGQRETQNLAREGNPAPHGLPAARSRRPCARPGHASWCRCCRARPATVSSNAPLQTFDPPKRTAERFFDRPPRYTLFCD